MRYSVNIAYYTFPKPVSIRYNAVSPSQLWAEFENYYFDTGFRFQEDVSFTNFIVSWTDQSGYPVINVSKKNSMFTITQVRRAESNFAHHRYGKFLKTN